MSIFRRLEGRGGKAVIKGLGSLVGEVVSWEATKPEESTSGLYKLKVQFGFLVPSLLLDPDYNDGKELHLALSKNRMIKVLLDNPERMALNGKILTMEGVTIEWLAA